MSDYRFGDDYRLNYDHSGNSPDDDCIDWDAVQWIEIDSTMFVRGRTCLKVPGKMRYGDRKPKCSECGYGLGDPRWTYCPSCGAKVTDLPTAIGEVIERYPNTMDMLGDE